MLDFDRIADAAAFSLLVIVAFFAVTGFVHTIPVLSWNP